MNYIESIAIYHVDFVDGKLLFFRGLLHPQTHFQEVLIVASLHLESFIGELFSALLFAIQFFLVLLHQILLAFTFRAQNNILDSEQDLLPLLQVLLGMEKLNKLLHRALNMLLLLFLIQTLEPSLLKMIRIEEVDKFGIFKYFSHVFLVILTVR